MPSTTAMNFIVTGMCIKCITQLCLLGITISRDLKWNTHASCTRQSISNMINIINRFGSALNTNACFRIFNTFIMPKLYFGQPVWCWINKSNEKAINHTLQCCARVALWKKSSKLDAETYAVTNLMPFGQLASLRYLSRTHQLLADDSASSYLPPLIPLADNGRITCNICKFTIPAHKATADVSCFSYMAAKYWNQLPFSTIKLTSHSLFMKNITVIITAKL